MKLAGRQDRVLLAGLGLALIVVFFSPLGDLLTLAQDGDRQSGLALLPALLILIAFFLFHQIAKRSDAQAEARADGARALQASAAVEEMERLVAFGHALDRSLEIDAIRDVVAQQLPDLAGSDEAWVMLRAEGGWEALIGTAKESRREVERTHQHIAERACAVDVPPDTVSSIETYRHLCIPMTAGRHTIGALGMPKSDRPFTEGRRRVLAAAATLLGIALRNAELFREVQDNNLRDGLTGCFQRAYALEVMATELRRARRSQAPVSLILFDIDRFKAINDRHGSLCGDAVLAGVGARMREVLRGSDLKCRYGGEEFLILLPETAVEGAKRVADTVRRELADMQVDWKGESVRVTASFGVTGALPSEIDSDAVIARASAALDRAKDQGRNCVRLSMETTVA